MEQQAKRSKIQIHLDRGLANNNWRILFRKASISYLLPLESDLSPMLLQTVPLEVSYQEQNYFDFWRFRPGIILPTASSKILGGRKSILEISKKKSNLRWPKLSLFKNLNCAELTAKKALETQQQLNELYRKILNLTKLIIISPLLCVILFTRSLPKYLVID